ncbi:MAG: carbon storage regulator [Planctomycetota bacterium]|jgi:carbon storage regulator
MLVLSRQRDESIMIGDEVEITIVEVRGDTKRIPVHRREVYDAIQAEKAGKEKEEQGEKEEH